MTPPLPRAKFGYRKRPAQADEIDGMLKAAR
jgi:hypothetical protein